LGPRPGKRTWQAGGVAWRSLPPEPADKPPRPVAASLGPLAASLGTPTPDVLRRLFTGWEQVVGPDVAAHARPVSLRDGVLLLAVDHPAWATQLAYLRGELLARIAATTGSDTVSDLRIRVARSLRN
jgi:hypothetical protein